MTATETMTPQPVTGMDLGFGPRRIGDFLPPYASIPQEFKTHNLHHDWQRIASRWFYKGLPSGTVFNAKEGIDADAALLHLRAVLSSWEPKHEHKMAGVAYLLSEWFESIEIPE